MTREEIYADAKQTLGLVPEFLKHVPDATIEHDWASFKALQLGETAIPNKYKELMGLAVASALQCPYCEYFHRGTAQFFGATEEELNEAGRLAMQTAGWSTFIGATGQSVEEFQKEFDRIIDYIRHQGEQKAA
jgi:AhpD family alkylhydroperoxidase